MARCACCGHEIEAGIEAVIARKRISGKQAAVLRMLDRSGPLEAAAVADRLYADAEDGGPDTALNAVHVHITHLRRKLRGEGLSVEWLRHRGYQLVAGQPGKEA